MGGAQPSEGWKSMIVDQWETDLAVTAAASAGAAEGEQPGPIGQLLVQNRLDELVRTVQEDLALLQAQQERGISSLGGAIEQIGGELNAVRNQLFALARPLLAAQAAATPAPDPQTAEARERAEIEARFERLEKQVSLLMRGLDSMDGLRYQSDVHTRALARLTDLLGEVVKPKPIEGLDALQLAVASLEHTHYRTTRMQSIALTLIGLGITPGIGAMAWLLVRGGL
jgi:hypothetical protein